MASEQRTIERLDQLISKGQGILSTYKRQDTLLSADIDESAYVAWRTQTLNALRDIFGSTAPYFTGFEKAAFGPYSGATLDAIKILKAAHEDAQSGFVDKTQPFDTTTIIENICDRFHLVVRQLRARHNNRETLNVQDEYDVQDLLHGLLQLHFQDIRAEENTPSYAGKSTRMDFLLKQENIVIEVKKTRPSLGARELSSELIEDTQRYSGHPGCKTLICFVYDPDGYIPNPRGIESDLRRDGDPFPVRVLVRPK